MNALTIAVLHQAVATNAPPDEQDVFHEAAAVSVALRSAGHRGVPVSLTLDLQAAGDQLRQIDPDVVFNLVESINGSGRFIGLAPLLLEEFNLPYTGACSSAINLTSNKLLAKQWLAAHGLPTPPWTQEGGAVQGGPWIVKSVWEHASLGLDDSAVLTNPVRLAEQLALRQHRFGGDWFAERYIAGREFNLALLENASGVTVLPAAEIQFHDFPVTKPHIVGYRAKWDRDSFEYQNTRRHFVDPAKEAKLVAQLHNLALQCWQTFHLSGYARVDFRIDAAGRPWILEINANPCLTPNAGFAAAAQYAGFAYNEVITNIVNVALPGGPSKIKGHVTTAPARRHQ
jgi:D-alanine-D-alanine ligase